MEQFTVSLNSDLVRKAKIVAVRKNLTLNQAVAEMAERGIEDYIYRMGRNQRVAAEAKEQRHTIKKMEERLASLGVDINEL